MAESVGSAKVTIDKFASELISSDDLRLENLTTISAGVAVIRYWYTIVPQITISLGLDFVPALFLLMIMLFHDPITQETAEKLRLLNEVVDREVGG